MLRQKGRAPLRRYTFPVYIPARYEVRQSRAARVVWALLSVPALVLAGYCLIGLIGAGGGLLAVSALLLPGALALTILLTLLALLAFAALLLFLPILAVKSRRDLLTVEDETLTLRRWRRKDKTFTFSDVGTVQTRQGRESIVLRDREGRKLCRLNVTMEGLDILMADLRSRRALFVERTGQIPDDPLPPLSPGPRKEEQALDLPAGVPGWYRLTCPGAFTAVFIILIVFCLGIAALAFLDGARWEALCLTPFVLLGVVGVVWVRRERIEVIGDHIRRQDGRGRTADHAFEDAAAARVRTTVTGIGPISTVQLLDRAGKPLLSPGAGMVNTELLLADLIRRGIPFTY